MNDEEVIAAPPDTASGSQTVDETKSAQDVQQEDTSSSKGDPADQTPPASGVDDDLAEFKKTVTEIVGKPEEKTESTETAKTDEAAPKTDGPEAAKPGEAVTDALSQQLKLTERPEWKDLTAIADKVSPEAGKQVRAALRGMYKREYDLGQLVEKAKPAQAVVREMWQSVGNSEQGFNNMRALIVNFDRNPQACVPMLQKLLSDAQQRAGLVIQSPEYVTEIKSLEQQVQDGTLTQEAFDRRKKEMLEVEGARASSKTATTAKASAEKTEQAKAAQAKMQQTIESLNKAEADWTANKLKTDPDFEAVQEMLGLYVNRNSQDFANTHKRVPTVAEANELLEKSLKQAKEQAGKFRPPARARRVVTDNGNGSSGNNRQQPATELDEFKQTVEQSHKARFG